MSNEIVRTEEEINEVLDKASDGISEGSAYPGMSYEDGVIAAIEWMQGEADEVFDDE